MILFLDDNHNRAAVMYQRMTDKERNKTIWCQTAAEAIDVIWNYRDRLEIAMLDHDLGGESYVNVKREDCGMEIIRFLEKRAWHDKKEFKKLQNCTFIVHSHNTYAAPRMVERLQAIGLKAIYQPFGT